VENAESGLPKGSKLDYHLFCLVVTARLTILPADSDPNIYKNVFSTHFRGIAIHPRCRILDGLPIGHVELPPMPGTGQHFTL
jgi:hypothetical protein